MTANLITLGQIRAAHPCGGGWKTLLGKTGQSPEVANLDLVLSIGDIARANGAADALWATRCIDDRRAVLRAVMPAVRRAAAHTQDDRVHVCIAAIGRWIDGDENVDLAEAARAAAAWAARAARAEAAAWAAAWAAAAWAAAWAARAAAEEAAAWAAAEAASAAAEAAAWAARAAAEAAEERERQVADIIAEFPLHFFKVTP